MKRRSAFVIMTLLLIASVLIAIRVGSVSVTLEDIVKAFTTGAKGTPGIVRDIRIPRVLMAVMVGANLAVSGVLLQGVMKIRWQIRELRVYQAEQASLSW